MEILLLVLVGLAAGVLAGLFGIGGGLLIVPILVYFWGMDLRTANGTSLGALLLPVGIFGVLEYHRAHHIDGRASLFIACGLILGTYVGARIVLQPMPVNLLRQIYAFFLLVVAVKMALGR